MSTSTGVNVLRWSALGLGIAYGFYHQSQITAREKLNQINHEYERKANVISQAKAEWTKKNAAPSAKTASGDMITDPEDPKFDLGAYLNAQK